MTDGVLLRETLTEPDLDRWAESHLGLRCAGGVLLRNTLTEPDLDRWADNGVGAAVRRHYCSD